jgi:transposase
MEPSMWALETRAEHDRDDLRYSSDLTDAEWQIPAPSSAGRHRSWQMCELINAIFFVLRGGVPWRMLPEHFRRTRQHTAGSYAFATTISGKA